MLSPDAAMSDQAAQAELAAIRNFSDNNPIIAEARRWYAQLNKSELLDSVTATRVGVLLCGLDAMIVQNRALKANSEQLREALERAEAKRSDEALAGALSDEVLRKRIAELEAGVHSVTINQYQLLRAVEQCGGIFTGSDLTIEWFDEHECDEDGEKIKRPAGYYLYWTEYPEEGSTPLDDSPLSEDFECIVCHVCGNEQTIPNGATGTDPRGYSNCTNCAPGQSGGKPLTEPEHPRIYLTPELREAMLTGAEEMELSAQVERESATREQTDEQKRDCHQWADALQRRTATLRRAARSQGG